jgi:hypothetical protein
MGESYQAVPGRERSWIAMLEPGVYVRQSTLRQVVHNTESATRQYAF